MSLYELSAITFDFLGKVLIAVTALLVHGRVRKEGKIDKMVLKELRLEQGLGILGILLIFVGYFMHAYSIGLR